MREADASQRRVASADAVAEIIRRRRAEADLAAQTGPGPMPRAVGAILKAAIDRQGWPGIQYAAACLGVDSGHLGRLVKGTRRPSVSLAQVLIEGLDLDELESALLLAFAAEGVGRDRPARDPSESDVSLAPLVTTSTAQA